MEREILFRGKRIEDGKWVEGYYQKRYDDFENIQHLIFWAKSSTVWEYAEVDPKTVCQYTGLTDKHGRKIFEGDIVNCNEKRGAAFWRCKVVWNDVIARYDVIAMSVSFPMCLDECEGDIYVIGSDYEVIGNIFDNPELLRGA